MIKITIRIPDEQGQLHKTLEKTAENNHRSLNGEILRAIEFYLKNAPEAQYQVKEVPKKTSPK